LKGKEMELKEFIKGTIASIVEATSELQNEFEAEGILINPPSAQSGSDVYQPGSKNYTFRRVKDIEFDVAVTTSDETAQSAKAGIKVFAAELGGTGKKLKGTENVSRVRFSIPLTLKPTKEEIKNLEKKSEHDAESISIP
jgi:hypothetical protein